MDATHKAGRCPRCGQPVPPDAPLWLCPACLLGAAHETLTHASGEDEGQTRLSPLSGAAAAFAGDVPRLDEGRLFGPYRIGRLLGRGGMGEVYEAGHIDTGRRLALKVLRGRLDNSEDRARFLREGQLAASVSHPHTVYIFGSEEIDGMPVISMELLPGGTLKDRVAARGPLPPAEAVSAVLDIIGGLDAAQAAGILHRDIKPSNCFIDLDGAVKVGDFGLSISTLARDVQAAAGPQGFQGTPHFAPPEQLRGEPLDVRADIYAVGATLYYLLTGEPPFDSKDLRDLVARVTTGAPPSPQARQPHVPRALARVVQQCLAKDPHVRPASYAALAEALRPFSKTAVSPARPGLRLAAGLVDMVLIAAPISLAAATRVRPSARSAFILRVDPIGIWVVIVGAIYFLAFEGIWSASPGKRLFGMRVAGTTTGVPDWRQIAVRTTLFYAPALPMIAAVTIFGAGPTEAFLAAWPAWGIALWLLNPVGRAALFLTLRRRNGFAALHDLISGTRVIVRPAAARRGSIADGERVLTPDAVRPLARCGPFDITHDLGVTDAGRMLGAFDPALRRRVWIRAVPPGTPPLADVRRDLGRATRLHWLSGRRSFGENWDAFEAPDGQALLARPGRADAWPIVKTWLVDLSAELAASAREGSTPVLALDRVWIRADGRAVLLDFPAPGAPLRAGHGLDGGLAALDARPVRFLAEVAEYALDGLAPIADRIAMPLSAAALLRGWLGGAEHSIDESHAALKAVAAAPDRVLRTRRVIPIALASLPIALALAASIGAVPAFRAATSPEVFEMHRLVAALPAANPSRTDRVRDPDHERDIEIYLAGRFRHELTDDRYWGASILRDDNTGLPAVAARVAAAHPDVTLAELQRATRAVAADRARIAQAYADIDRRLERGLVVLIVTLIGIASGFSLLCSLVSVAIAPGGLLLRLLGLAVVTHVGVEIGRARGIGRVLVAWSPLVALATWSAPSPVSRLLDTPLSPAALIAAALSVMAAGAVWSIVSPARGPHDWIARTRIVPR